MSNTQFRRSKINKKNDKEDKKITASSVQCLKYISQGESKSIFSLAIGIAGKSETLVARANHTACQVRGRD